MVFIITFSIATILFHCVDLSHPIKSFPAWSSKLFLLWNIFSYFDTAFLFFFFFLIVEWYFIVFIYHLLWTCVPFVVTILAVCADRVAVKLVTETHAGIRRGSICHSKAKAVGEAGDPDMSSSVTEQFDQPCWILTSALVCPSLMHAYTFVSGCLEMPLSFLLLLFLTCYKKPIVS